VADSLEERKNLRLTSGDTKTIRVETGDDLSGTSVDYAVADERAGSEQFRKESGGSGIAIVDAASGIFEIYLDPSDTQDLRGGYWHEAEYEDGDGDVTTVFTGRFVVRPDTV
jgi:hypothetical protein